MIEVRELTDGGQEPLAIARELAAFIAPARRTLELALYDVRLVEPQASVVVDAVHAAAARGVAVRVVHNVDHDREIPVPPPPQGDPDEIAAFAVPTRAIPGTPDLMHHKYAVRDGEALWSGSTNWTEDSWSREENVIVRLSSEGVCAAFRQDFEQLWRRGRVEGSGAVAPRAVDVGGVPVTAWFCPEHGESLSQRIATVLGLARRRIRIASPVLTSGPVLGTLAELAGDGRVDLAGVIDATQIRQVFGQWRANGRAGWKLASLGNVLAHADFTGKVSTPYAPGSVHDYMHAKVTVADDTVFVGSFNLSHSGEHNAENVLEIVDAALADWMAAFVDSVRARYPRAPLP
ncbi:MAG: phosphatidylserine/phosphatidylglycerophosphate/cardiolipin synthase family protein [Solirubrobacterales bacterium]|nr:phosphatidylserine/phosphatidylglycerophosphate/cardiolipin synthase family protein [Solirubrobacterales bacterium]